MNTEQRTNILYFGNERRTFTRDNSITLELEYLREQMLQTTCQEVADLYIMLRHKCMQGQQLLDFKPFPVLTGQTH